MADSVPPPRRAHLLRSWWPLLLALLPSLYYIVDLADFAALPYNDYYEVLYDITDDGGFRTDLASWVTIRSNEHRVTLPALVYWANYQLTGGDNRGHSVVTLLLIVGSLFLLLRWLAKTLPPAAPTIVKAMLALTLGILLFNPVQGHNVTMGFSGVMWLLSNFLAIASITVLVCHPSDRFAGWFAAALGVGGAFSYSSNLMLWPVLLVGCLLYRLPRRRWLPVVVVGVSVFLFYFGTFDKPANSPNYQLNLVTMIRFTCTYLGALFTGTTRIASLIGGFGILSLFLIAAQELKTQSRQSASLPPTIWLLLALYSLGNAIGTSVGRAALTPDGIQTAFASRYANISGLFWIGTILSCSLLLARAGFRSPTRKLLAVSGAALISLGAWLMYQHGDRDYQRRLQAAKRQPLAAYAVQNGAFPQEFMGLITPWTGGYTRMVPRLRVMRHVPFDQAPEFPYGEVVARELLDRSRSSPLVGTIDHQDSTQGLWVLRGKLRSTNQQLLESAEALVFVDASGEVRGYGVPGFGRPGELEAMGIARWQAIVLPLTEAPLEAWIQLSDQPLTLQTDLRFTPNRP